MVGPLATVSAAPSPISPRLSSRAQRSGVEGPAVRREWKSRSGAPFPRPCSGQALVGVFGRQDRPAAISNRGPAPRPETLGWGTQL